MVASGKWGKSIYKNDEMSIMEGSRMYDKFYYVKSSDLISSKKLQGRIKNGDILFLVKHPELRSKKTHAMIGHLGILEVGNDGEIYLIHASGVKRYDVPQGKVKKVKLVDYLIEKKDRWAGVHITRI